MSATIMLVDDEAHITCVVGTKLRAEGYAVLTARDGEEAFDLAMRRPPALVITDLQMPRMSGLELAQRLKECPATASVPLIMLTARGYIADSSSMARTNIVRLISKPFSAREVVRLVAELVGPTLAQPGREAA
jgi:two-component system alkaline phosphatase synthesis response regulator PhoP